MFGLRSRPRSRCPKCALELVRITTSLKPRRGRDYLNFWLYFSQSDPLDSVSETSKACWGSRSVRGNSSGGLQGFLCLGDAKMR